MSPFLYIETKAHRRWSRLGVESLGDFLRLLGTTRRWGESRAGREWLECRGGRSWEFVL